jgi:hypothetical protein
VIVLTLALTLTLASTVAWGQPNTTTYNTVGTHTYTVPAGVTEVTVEAWGGGGGGGTRTTTGRGGGGGGGAYARSVLSVIPGTVYTNGVVVGSGGGGSQDGSNSSFNGTTVVAAGGSGAPQNNNNGASGGTEPNSTGDVIYAGGNGGNAFTGNPAANRITGAGGGGAGSNGAGGNATRGTAGTGTATNGGNGGAGHNTDNTNGNPGHNYGGGGSGARRSNGTRTGGAGAQGLVIITYATKYYSTGSGNPALTSSWNTQPDGSGSAPANTTGVYQKFIIQNGHTMTTAGAWTLGEFSGIQIEDGGLLNTNNAINIAANGVLRIENGGALNVNVNSIALFNGLKILAENSTVNYNHNGNQPVASADYGNLVINGSGNKTSANAFTVANSLTVTEGNLVLAGTGANYTVANNLTVSTNGTLTHSVSWDGTGMLLGVSGNISIEGTYDYSTAGRAHIQMTGAGSKTIRTGTTALSILTLQNGDYSANGPVTVNDNFWAMFGTPGSFSTNGQVVTANAGVLINGGVVNINGGELNVTASINIGIGGNNGQVNFSLGALNTDNITLGNAPQTGTFNHSGGTANISNNINFATTGTYTATGSPVLNVSGAITNGGTFNAGEGTVNYTNTGDQPVGAYSYYNLTLTGGGNKTIQGHIRVNNSLTLDNGNLATGSGTNNITLAPGATLTATGGFNNTRMIVCNGDGSLIVEGTDAAGFVRVYPLGTGTYYTPFAITSLTATVTGTGTVSARAVAGQAPDVNTNDLNKHWIIGASNLSGVTTSASFEYNAAEVLGNPSIYKLSYYNGIEWITPSGISGEGINPMTITGSSVLDGTWTAKEPLVTYYSYQSGTWNDPNTWTTDPSGTLSRNRGVPTLTNRVVILNGRTVTMDISGEVYSLQLNEGGVLDLGTIADHNFTLVTGKGLLRLSSNSFPSGNFDGFVGANGGTVEYYNNADFSLGSANQLVYNNIIFNLSTSGTTATILGNLDVNGDLTVQQGTFRINDNTATTRLDIAVKGNVLVESSGLIRLGTGNIGTGNNNAHRFIVRGDFTNNGDAWFTNLVAAVYNNVNHPNNRVDVVFDNPTSDQSVLLNGPTRFYRIEIDKGFDKTYVLNIDATNTNYFNLWGKNNLDPSGTPPSIPNPQALGLLAGTVRLGANITLPSLAETGVYNIDEDAMLWLDGANVTYSTVANTANGTTIIIYGGLRVSPNSILNDNSKQGLVMRTTSSLLIEGGTINTECVRTSYETGVHRGAFTMTGGSLTIRAVSLPNLTGMNTYGAFTLPYPDNTVSITGGDINILSPTPIAGGSGSNFSIVFGSDPNNISITGGVFNITVPAARDAYIASRAPFWDLNIISAVTNRSAQSRTYTANDRVPIAIPAQPLIVKNNLSLQNSAVLTSGPNVVNVIIAGNFNIPSGTTYTPGNNTTIFNGLGSQQFNNAGTITTGLYNLEITNSSTTAIAQNLTIRNDLTIDTDCELQDLGRTISVGGNIINSGLHTSQAAGSITLTSGVAQTIGGNGNGAFGNLTLNKTGNTTSLSANTTVNGLLRLGNNGLLNAGIYRLSLGAASRIYDAATGVGTSFTGTKMIRTAGNMSDGGVTKEYDAANTTFLFPIGTAADYTPATISIGASNTKWGSVNVKPVSQANPFITSSNSLTYYWKVTHTGFEEIPTNSVSHTYRYVDSDLRGTENLYIPGVYNPYSWALINDVSQVVDGTNSILFNNVSYLSGDYTAGYTDAFQAVKVYYSIKDGPWNDLSTWSNTSNAGPADASVLPEANSPVVIGNGTTHNHTVTIPAGVNNITVGGLQINTGSILDITTTTGHNFGAIPDSKVTGNGTLRISSAVATAAFPAGDFGNFLSTGGGTVEYYNTGTTDFTLPAGITYYNNLSLSPANGRWIRMPNINMTIYGNFTASGTGTGVAQLNSAAARTLTVEGDITVTSGTLRFMNNTFAQTVYANGHVILSAGANFDVSTTTNATNSLYIRGSLNNMGGTFDMYGANTARVTNIYFIGNTNQEISGTGGTNEFNYLYVDKGTTRNTILDVTADNLTLQGAGTALVLYNGTFRVSNALLNFTLATTSSFTIPNSAALSVNLGTINIGTTSSNGDLVLNGRLEVINQGVVNIGIQGQNLNNDIEYASGGSPEIIVNGNATLFVNGQIRRPTTISSGSLVYSQGGTSTVTIDGRLAQNSRAMLEILNSGSRFTMTGGTLNISRTFNNALYTDLYLTPDSSSITGGSIVLGSSAVTNGSNIYFATSTPLWNLTVDATTTTKTANARIFPINVLNNLTIDGNSVFNANGLNVAIGGNLMNNNIDGGSGINTGGYRPGSPTQITTFNGANQSIQGNGTNLTNFANVVVNSSGTLSLGASSNVMVNGNLSLQTGTLHDGTNTITVMGNVENRSVHTSGAGGKLMLNGSGKQYLTGMYGTFGNLEIDNSNGVEMTTNLTINGTLTFTNGILYIDDYLLTLGVNATIAGSPDETRMIMPNGVLSDYGVRKLFPAGTSPAFTFPIGVTEKYTPVTYTVHNTGTPGSITVKPINNANPAATDALVNELSYYWSVSSSGFDNPEVSHVYQYLQGDVKEQGTDTETNYVAASFDFTTYLWTILGDTPPTYVDENANRIILSNVSYIDGEYTAGASTNFAPTQILYSRNDRPNNNWNGTDNWSTTGHDGASCGCTPNGNPVIIASGHTIVLNANSAYSYSVEINGTLETGTTTFHNLGHVQGGGLLRITSTAGGMFVFPGGVYDSFFDNPSSTLEFTGNNTASLPLKPGNFYKPFQNVIFSGTGRKEMSAENMRVNGNLTIANGTVLSNTRYNKDIYISGNWADNNTAQYGFTPGTGTVIFNGASAQTLTANYAERFYSLKIDNAEGLTLLGAAGIEVSRFLYLTSGNIRTNSTNILHVTNTATNAVSGGSSSSFVDGPLMKTIISGSSFIFPIGNEADGVRRYGNLRISSVSATGNYVAQYFNQSADDHTPAMGTDAYSDPLDVVSKNEYWSVYGSVPSTAVVRLRWDNLSTIIPPAASSRSKLRVAEWNGSSWVNRGGAAITGTPTAGTYTTSGAITVTNPAHYLTIGVESLPTVTITSGDDAICNDGVSTTNIMINLTGDGPWNVRYKVNGGTETLVPNIGFSPYPIPISSLSPGISGPGEYQYTLSYVTDATGATGVKDFTSSVTITVNESPSPVISGLTALPLNTTAQYTTGTSSVPGRTYLWETDGNISAGQGTYAATISWGTYGTKWVRVTETITATGCSTVTENYIVNITDIPEPAVNGSSEVCNGSIETYFTQNVPGRTYLWTLPDGGGTIVGLANSASVQVQWSSVSVTPFRVRVAETGSSTVTDELSVSVYPVPANNNAVSNPSICNGETAEIVVTGAAGALSFLHYLVTTNNPGGGAVNSGPGGNVTLTAAPLTTTEYYIVATSEYGCSATLTNTSTVTVNPKPIVTLSLAGSDVACEGDVITLNIEYTNFVSPFTIVVYNDGVEDCIYSTEGEVGTIAIPAGNPFIHTTKNLGWAPGTDPFTVHPFTITVTNSASGCVSDPLSEPVNVTVWKRPETGPQYHIPNSHGL